MNKTALSNLALHLLRSSKRPKRRCSGPSRPTNYPARGNSTPLCTPGGGKEHSLVQLFIPEIIGDSIISTDGRGFSLNTKSGLCSVVFVNILGLTIRILNTRGSKDLYLQSCTATVSPLQPFNALSVKTGIHLETGVQKWPASGSKMTEGNDKSCYKNEENLSSFSLVLPVIMDHSISQELLACEGLIKQNKEECQSSTVGRSTLQGEPTWALVSCRHGNQQRPRRLESDRASVPRRVSNVDSVSSSLLPSVSCDQDNMLKIHMLEHFVQDDTDGTSPPVLTHSGAISEDPPRARGHSTPRYLASTVDCSTSFVETIHYPYKCCG
ncbi:hypothetical protein J6590_018707 [Homalodisca vitripennis]|nr:hypothetical protein J6590_018707 [Homalodisca vitripennis]